MVLNRRRMLSHMEYPRVLFQDRCFFAFYINDIYEAVGMDFVRLFADDTALYMWHKGLTTLVGETHLKFFHMYI